MKILLISDTHIHTWKSFNVQSSSLLSKQLLNQEDMLDNQIMKVIDDNNIHLLIHGGDIFHEVGKVPVECLNIVHRFFNNLAEKDIDHLIVAGNHDLIKREDGKWYHNITNLYVDSTIVSCKSVHGIKLGIINFDDEVDYDKLVGYDLIVAHKTPIGAVHGKFMFDDGVDWKRLSANNRLVFFGHIHQNQKLSDNCYVIGSPMHFNFGDAGDRGVYIIDTDIWSVEFIKLKYPEFITVDNPSQVADDYNYYRVMHGDEIMQNKSNVIVVHTPQVYEEKIKATNINDILSEWLSINGKDSSLLDVIKDDIGRIESSVTVINKLKLVSVSIKDFLSIGIADYELYNGFILINGQSDNFSSNGSGKTALVDAIYWALFGKTTKGLVGDDVIRRGLKNCFVELTMVDNGNTYIINRSRKNGISVKKNGKECAAGFRIADAQVLLNGIIGFDENLYMSSCYFSQENLLMFTDMSDTDRINIVSQLLGFHVYDGLYELVFEKIKLNNAKLFDISSVVNRIKVDLDKVAIKVSNTEDIIKTEEGHINRCMAIVETCQHEIEDIYKLMKSEDNNRPEKVDYIKMLEVVERHCRRLLDFGRRFDKEYERLVSAENNARIELSKANMQYNKLIESQSLIRNKLGELRSLSVNQKCDKCGSMITAENVSLFIAEKENDLEGLDVAIKEAEVSIKDVYYKVEVAFSKRKEKRFMIDRCKELVTKYYKKRDSIIAAKSNYDNILRDVAIRKSKLESKINSNKSIIENNSGQVDRHKANIRAQEALREKFGQEINTLEVEMLNEQLREDGIKAEVGVLEFWKDSFSSKGIKSILLDRFCNDINVVVNECLSMISSGVMSIDIKPTATTKMGEERNKLGIDITVGGDIVKYESLSGGEKKRIDFSLCMALNAYVSNRHGIQSGILGVIILDELFSYLDKSGEESIGQYLHNVSKNRAVLVITHTDELSSYADSIWTVVKSNGISKLVFN